MNEVILGEVTALEAVKTAINKYNNQRPHRSIDMMFPSQAHKMTGSLKKHWKQKPLPLNKKSLEPKNPVMINKE
ncbi:hypothetical protein ACT3CE_15790 [Marinifilum sp. RC60d5]|uniref:hypothetical protein n=1 Tax=Marinifilum sp. RC60d5 TaxID=3458414 RepID=UPI0040372FCB